MVLFVLTHHSTKPYPQIMQKISFDWSTDISQSLIDYICKLCPKYNIRVSITSTPCYQLILCNCRVKKNVPCTINTKLWTQCMTVVSILQSREKSALLWQKENGRKVVIITISHSTTNDIYVRWHFQVKCDNWRKL